VFFAWGGRCDQMHYSPDVAVPLKVREKERKKAEEHFVVQCKILIFE
jgi:hypothetical protein